MTPMWHQNGGNWITSLIYDGVFILFDVLDDLHHFVP
jgi:hypothetical protein